MSTAVARILDDLRSRGGLQGKDIANIVFFNRPRIMPGPLTNIVLIREDFKGGVRITMEMRHLSQDTPLSRGAKQDAHREKERN